MGKEESDVNIKRCSECLYGQPHVGRHEDGSVYLFSIMRHCFTSWDILLHKTRLLKIRNQPGIDQCVKPWKFQSKEVVLNDIIDSILESDDDTVS